ncbi:pyocin knob domain-containing protein [Lentilactobacillus kefiri]|uniref:pyocin knob domain-containing protein n=1 Tax=Lentilactobacillus kefiri TaxID=33962 RepID=UPI001CDB0EE3|nr:pyocin knob domain-containing protein [Lentilactobacillus kefiri]
MSKELAFTDDNDVVKYLDTTTAFNLALTADGVAFDLTNAKSILVKIANDDGYIMQQTIDLTTVTSPLGGTLSFPINQDIMNTLVPDDYDIEVWVTMKDGTQAIFPSDGTLGFSIEENLMSDTGEVIPTITLNDFQQQFDDLSSQMENAVHNVHKGDQGNPGNGIKSANNQYQLSDSPVTVPTGGWSDTILATTDQLPYLWTKIIFIYDDGTTKEINFVSSRGDTGSQGPIGPVGPQGKQGNGLVVRGKADKEKNLPTTGNNQGDGYLVGTDLYIWIDGSWQNMGSITPDLADYVKVADMNNALNTKVNVTDMRKPASDVAGIEEVNAKQDKIAYTPADDSKVLHTTLTQLNSTDMNTVLTAGFYQLNSGTNGMPNVDNWTIYQVIPLASSNGVQLAYGTNNDISGMRTWNNWNSFTSWVQFADDSKVVHKTGNEDIAGQKTFDTAPIDKTTGNPYITKDGVPAVPSTLADTTKDTNFTRKLQKSGIDVATTTDVKNAVNTATSNVVTTNKLANFTAGLQSGGVSVATSDDLKSVEKSAWRQLDQSNASSDVFFRGQVLYKIDDAKKRIYFITTGKLVASGHGSDDTSDLILIDFKGIVNNLLSGQGNLIAFSETGNNYSDISVTSTYVQDSIYGLGVQDPDQKLFSYGDPGQNYAYVTYDSLVNN